MRRKRKIRNEHLFLDLQAIVTLTFLALVAVSIIDSPKDSYTPIVRGLLSGLFIIVYFLVSFFLAKKHKYSKLVWLMIGSFALALVFYSFVLN